MKKVGYINMTNDLVVSIYDDIKFNKTLLKTTSPREDLIDLLINKINASTNQFILIKTYGKEYYLNKSNIVMIVKN